MQTPIRRTIAVAALPNPNLKEVWALNACRAQDDPSDIGGLAETFAALSPDALKTLPAITLAAYTTPQSPNHVPFLTVKGQDLFSPRIIDGYRRTGAFHQLIAKYPTGNLVEVLDPETGEPTKHHVKYDEMNVLLFIDLTEAQYMELAVAEVGNRRGMTRQGLMKAINHFIETHPAYTWQTLNNTFRQPFEDIYGPLAPDQTRRPTIQDIERALSLPGDLTVPTTPKGAWYAKQATQKGSGFPTNSQVRELVKLADLAASKVPVDPVTNQRPPQQIEQARSTAIAPLWTKILQEHTANPNGGKGTSPRALPGKALATLQEIAKNPKTLVFLRIVMGEFGQEPTDLFLQLDAAMDQSEDDFRTTMKKALGL